MQNVIKEKHQEEAVKPFDQPLSEAETLVNDIKKMLVKSEPALAHEEKIKTEMETLERWMESYRRGLSAANKIATSGSEIVNDIKDRLKLAIEEMHRLEDEGGNTATKSEAADTEDMVKALRRLENLIPSIEETFSCNLQSPPTDQKPDSTKPN